MSRLEEKYRESIAPQLQKDLDIDNVMAIPRMTKVVVNIGEGEAAQNIKLLDAAMDELGRITGQKPLMRPMTGTEQFRIALHASCRRVM